MYYPWAAWWWWFAWVIPMLLLFWAFSGNGRRGGYGYSRRGANGDYWRAAEASPKYRNRAPRNYRRSDDRIFEDVCSVLMASNDVDPSALDVYVTNGEVRLTGTVESRYEKQLAEHLADSVAGVTDVDNQLRIGRVDHTTPATPPTGTEPLPSSPHA
jgi:hypothetical protein